jgi:hypothetical protein
MYICIYIYIYINIYIYILRRAHHSSLPPEGGVTLELRVAGGTFSGGPQVAAFAGVSVAQTTGVAGSRRGKSAAVCRVCRELRVDKELSRDEVTRTKKCTWKCSIRQRTSAYVSIRQHASAYVSM